MECQCIDGYDGDQVSGHVFVQKVRKAKKHHKCIECDDTIEPGQKYEYVSGVLEGEFITFKTCLICHEIGRELYCRGYPATMLWDDLSECQTDINLSDLERFSKEAQIKICENL